VLSSFIFGLYCIVLCILHCPGVGGIEAEAVMLGQSVSMVLPQVVGYQLTGRLGKLTTSTDVVLTITKVLSITSNFTVICS